MKTRKKNRFLTFCCSLFPGAAEMYMGFMKTGVSLMLLFILTIAVTGFLKIGALASIGVVIWFYGFFHANHLAGLRDEDFATVKDEYVLGLDSLAGGKEFVVKYQKWIAAVLIFLGAWLLLDTFGSIAYAYLPRSVYMTFFKFNNLIPKVIFAVVIIIAGINMIKGRKIQLFQNQDEKQTEDGKTNDKVENTED